MKAGQKRCGHDIPANWLRLDSCPPAANTDLGVFGVREVEEEGSRGLVAPSSVGASRSWTGSAGPKQGV